MRFAHRILTYCQGEFGQDRLMWYMSDAEHHLDPVAEHRELQDVLAQYGEAGWEIVTSHAVPAASDGQPLLYCIILTLRLA